jgi:hypothetical protein
MDEVMDIDISAEPPGSPSIRSKGTLSAAPLGGSPINGVKKLEDPFNFERDRSRERKPGQRSESLLSRRLKDLAFQAQSNGEDLC